MAPSSSSSFSEDDGDDDNNNNNNNNNNSPIVSRDPSNPIDEQVKPLIADILRTRYCVLGSVLLVEGIERRIQVEITPTSSKSKRRRRMKRRAVRVILGDGEVCIQGIVRAEAHWLVDRGVVWEGAYVRLDKFEVGYVGGEGDDKEVFLLIGDMVTVGWNRDYLRILGVVSTERALARRVTLAAQREEPPPQGDQHQQPPENAPQDEDPPPPPPRPWMAQDPTRPLKLTPLSKIPNLPYKQNWMVNILAVVVSLSDVESCTIPPYIQRTARLADPSTTKQVHLTVFLEPDKFIPTVGSVILLVGVKNHRFDGGSLKKYVSDRLKGGRSWWVQRPGELGWCEEEVRRLEGWWGG
ncbi:hypothetical protein QBC44DRAFT_296745 [Cladorrhinum sp. PSN332]|nr:hypothetical protein QBC44DRAFT_296745 [Cladorrhinum sp. PSN332]